MAQAPEKVGGLQKFAYDNETPFDGPKRSWNMARGEILSVGAQIVKDGGETNLHAHTAVDSTWFVIEGKARFYGEDGVPVVLNKLEGVFIPKAVAYWFESAGSEPLQILHLTGRDKATKSERINYEELKDWQQERDLGGRPA